MVDIDRYAECSRPDAQVEPLYNVCRTSDGLWVFGARRGDKCTTFPCSGDLAAEMEKDIAAGIVTLIDGGPPGWKMAVHASTGAEIMASP